MNEPLVRLISAVRGPKSGLFFIHLIEHECEFTEVIFYSLHNNCNAVLLRQQHVAVVAAQRGCRCGNSATQRKHREWRLSASRRVGAVARDTALARSTKTLKQQSYSQEEEGVDWVAAADCESVVALVDVATASITGNSSRDTSAQSGRV